MASRSASRSASAGLAGGACRSRAARSPKASAPHTAAAGNTAYRFTADKHVRRSAAYALARFGRDASDAIPALKEALQDENPKVREAAAYAIKEIQNPHPKQKSDKSGKKENHKAEK